MRSFLGGVCRYFEGFTPWCFLQYIQYHCCLGGINVDYGNRLMQNGCTIAVLFRSSLKLDLIKFVPCSFFSMLASCLRVAFIGICSRIIWMSLSIDANDISC